MQETTYRAKALKLYPPPRGKTEVQELLMDIKKDIDNQLEQWQKPASPEQ
jgi:hypothetical protein